MRGKKLLVLIVDDEEKDRSVVRILLNRQYGERFEILEAGSASQARDILEQRRVDLLMLDIHMPGMGGLELLEELWKKGIRPYTIILTAYSYFEYAREAIRYQVSDFLLKPPVRKELHEAVQRFLDGRQEAGESPRMEEASRLVLSRILGSSIILNGDRQEIDACKKLLDIREDRVFCILIENGLPQPGRKAALEQRIGDVMDGAGMTWIMTDQQDRTAVFCFAGGGDPGGRDAALAARLREALASFQVGGIALGEPASLYEDPGRTYRSALAQLNQAPESAGEAGEPVEDLLSGYLKAGELEKAVECLTGYLMRYGEEHNFDDLMLEDIKILTVVRKNARVREGSIGLKMLDIFVTGSAQDIVRFSCDYLREIAENQSLPVQEKKHHAVRSICARVMEHLETPWSINDFAETYGFNPVYLGRLFKEETGLSFTNYLMERRIEKAIAMMADPNLTIGAIGQAVGYSDQNYFSRVFKKQMGTGPYEYRRSLTEQGSP